MKTTLGLFGIFGIWITMATMALSELLPLSGIQLTLLRGTSGLLIIGVFAFLKKGIISLPDRNTMRLTFFFGVATLALFQGIKIWGANLSAILLDLAVLVPIILSLRRKEKVDNVVIIAFATAILGSTFALRIWDVKDIIFSGLIWSLVAMIANGYFIEYAGKAKQSDLCKTFWISVGLVVIGSFGFYQFPLLTSIQWKIAILIGFATGLLNFLCVFVAFKNLKAVWVGVLVLGVTPSIMISSYFFLHKSMGSDQLFGVAITLISIGVLGNFLRAEHKNT